MSKDYQALKTPKGRTVFVTKNQPCFPTGDNKVYRAHSGDLLLVSIQDHWERPSRETSLERLDEMCDRLCVRGTA